MKFSRSLARLFAFTATMTTLGMSAQSDAHAILTSPKPRDTSDANKAGPCGPAPIVNGPNLYTPGATMTVSWKETINHPGCFVVEWSTDGNKTFTNLATVKHTTVGALPRPYSTQVTLPAGNCTSCTLRMIQWMLADDLQACPPATIPLNSQYFSCAEMTTDPIRLADMAGMTVTDMAMSSSPDMAVTTPPPGDGGTTATGCNFPAQTATSTGGLLILAAAAGLLRRRR
ncbi:MAG TPA: hypothetical protein PLY80_15525 [Pseudomonadota bacterium]|nr:hypothetical protein [Pseudomonadota bacterium]